MVILGREFGWTLEEMRKLSPQELSAILNELQRQVALEQFNEQRNKWAFLAAVMANGFSALANSFSSKRRKPKMVQPDDFMAKDAKKMLQRLLGQEPEEKSWIKHVRDAKAKGLRGPW